jgi:hypothetical protein
MRGRAAHWIARELAAPAVDPLVDRALGAYGDVARGARGAATFYRGSSELSRSGRRGYRWDREADGPAAGARREAAAIKGEIWHGAGDRELAIGQIGSDLEALHVDIGRAASAGDANAQALLDVIGPTIVQWDTFVSHERSTVLAPWVTEWSTFETWWQRVRALRDAAKAKGIPLASPEMAPLPKTIWQRAESGTGTTLDVWISALKTVILGTMAIVGAAGFCSVVRDFSRRTEHS